MLLCRLGKYLFIGISVCLCSSLRAEANYASPWEQAYKKSQQEQQAPAVGRRPSNQRPAYYEDEGRANPKQKRAKKKRVGAESNIAEGQTGIPKNKKDRETATRLAEAAKKKKKITASTDYDVYNYYEEPVYNPLLTLSNKYLFRYGASIKVRDAGASYYSMGGVPAYGPPRVGKDKEVILFGFE